MSGGEGMEAACAENRKRGFAMARSVTETSTFFAPTSVMRTLEDQIGHGHEKLANGPTKAHQANGTAKSQSGTLVSVTGSLAR
jgi:hypothetical protein